MCPARQVSVLKRQRSGLNQLIKMLQFPFPPLLRPLSGTFRQNQSLNCFKKNYVYLWPLQGVWPAPEIAPGSILSVIKALKSAAGWLSQIYSALNHFRGLFRTALNAFRLATIAPGRSVPGRRCWEHRAVFFSELFLPFYSLYQEEKSSSRRSPSPSRCPFRRDEALVLLCRAGRGDPTAGPAFPAAASDRFPGAGGRGTPQQAR